MRLKMTLILIGVLLGGMILGAFLWGYWWPGEDVYKPVLAVMGDVDEPFDIKSMDGMKTAAVNRDGESVTAVPLQTIIDSACPWEPVSDIYIRADDGLTVKLNASEITESYISYSADNAWEAININHPPSSRVKYIKEIIVVSEADACENAIGFISPDENIQFFTPGQLYADTFLRKRMFEGSAALEVEDNSYDVTVYTTKNMLKFSDLIEAGDKEILVWGRTGASAIADQEGYLEIVGNKLDYVFPDMEEKIEDVVGFIQEPVSGSITDTYRDALNYLQEEKNVLVIILDGFGYHQYLYAVENGYAPFLRTISSAEKVASVFKPVTNAGLAAMLTGKLPAENGIYSRDQKDLKTGTIFTAAESMDISSVMVEGNIGIINVGIEQTLNLDRNRDGTADDEIMESALQKIGEGFQLEVVHFHSIDDCGHDYGDLDERTMTTVATIDRYVQKLVQQWQGEIIITADHGMHATAEAGSHGRIMCQDMFVPYLKTQGEK